MLISIEIMFLQVRENLKNISKRNIILTFVTLAENSPRDFAIFFFHTSWTVLLVGVVGVVGLRWF